MGCCMGFLEMAKGNLYYMETLSLMNGMGMIDLGLGKLRKPSMASKE